MFPVIQIGPLALQTDTLSLLLALWAGLAVSARLAAQLNLDGDHIYNTVFAALLAGIVAGRLAHVLAFWTAYRSQPLDVIGLNPRAFILWPAAGAAALTVTWYVLSHRLSWALLLDAAAPGLIVGFGVADLGNLLSGHALGRPAAVPWAITYWGVARHPSQLYEVLANLAILAAALYVLRRTYRPGRVAWTAVLGYGLARWLLEPFRADSATILGGLREAQVLSLAAALVALWALGRGRGRGTSTTGEEVASSDTPMLSSPPE